MFDPVKPPSTESRYCDSIRKARGLQAPSHGWVVEGWRRLGPSWTGNQEVCRQQPGNFRECGVVLENPRHPWHVTYYPHPQKAETDHVPVFMKERSSWSPAKRSKVNIGNVTRCCGQKQRLRKQRTPLLSFIWKTECCSPFNTWLRGRPTVAGLARGSLPIHRNTCVCNVSVTHQAHDQRTELREECVWPNH